MNRLTIIVLGKKNKGTGSKDDVDFVFSNGTNLSKLIKGLKTKYFLFVREDDKLSDDFFDIVRDKCNEDFDSCFINYKINYEYKSKVRILHNEYELSQYYPLVGEYIWSFIFNRELFIPILDLKKDEINQYVKDNFKNKKVITKLIYFHNPKTKRLINKWIYNDIKDEVKIKNLIYMGIGCSGIFNGYVSWLKNLGRCFSDKYKITILYDEIHPTTLKLFSEFFDCIKYDPGVNYLNESYCATYTNYFYPKNIIILGESYMFIHGCMSDYDNSMHFKDDLYSHYVGVSKVASDRAVGYFPTDHIETIWNPFMIDENMIKPHLKLCSAHRTAKVKRPERVEKMAKMLDELDIPYTWNLFTDVNENTNKGGLIIRNRVPNPLPYINDADYFVLLSDSEAMPYSVLEALSLNTKVIVTPLEAFFELGVKDGENGIVIPFDYFDDGNEDKLKKVLLRAYKEKDKEINYKFDESLYKGYNDIFL